tara:strand:+ start:35098 stop:36669 length:1572 start_codon:yes stop_codon:yes gene_type:complete
MIAKRVNKTAKIGEDFTRLGEYIAAAREAGEKLDQLWIGNCAAGDSEEDLDAALAEVEAVRQLKGGNGNRTYHLIVSFREGEREKLTPHDLKEIAKSYADALGFGDHQYVAGTHINTDNFHMHIAFNKIHPVTWTIHTPFRDFKILEKTSRAMEKQFELTVDRGMSDREELQGELSPAARDYESETWEVSFQRWMLEQKEPIMAVLQGATNWQEVHAGLAVYGVRLQQRGAGLVFRDHELKHSMKASALDRAVSAKRLSERLGPFERAAGDMQLDLSDERKSNRGVYGSSIYRPRPLMMMPAGAKSLWQRYIGKRRIVPSTRGIIARNWRTFLQTEAHTDPLAFVMVVAQRELLEELLRTLGGDYGRGGAEIRQNKHNGAKTVTPPDTGIEGKLIERAPSEPSRIEPRTAGIDESPKVPTAAALVRFIEHGHAPFKNDPSNPKSYYVTVEKPGGQPHTIWGVDLERAIGEAKPAPGALVRIERTGAKKVLGRNGETFEKNTWAVRPETYRRERSLHSERDLDR